MEPDTIMSFMHFMCESIEIVLPSNENGQSSLFYHEENAQPDT